MKCWVCGSEEMAFKREGKRDIDKNDLMITDSRYGITLPLYKCKQCGFMQCDTDNLSDLYEQLDDTEYIESSEQRLKQFDSLLKKTMPFIKGGNKVLDVGAGAGMFVKLALERGLDAKGVEPSAYLANYAISRGLPVINSSDPDYPDASFDAIYMTDVIEHIADPLPLLRKYGRTLKPGGVMFVSTPNVSSLLARLMGKRWWHFRIAHIGYYSKKTLDLIMKKAGLKLIAVKYSVWYFSVDYILERIPFIKKRFSNRKKQKSLIIPACFFDSFIGIYTKDG